MANKHPIKRYPLDLDPNSKEAKWLEQQDSRKRSLIFLIDQAIDQFGDVDLIDALLGQVTLADPGKAVPTSTSEPAKPVAPTPTKPAPKPSAPASKSTPTKATMPVGLDRLSKRN